MSYLRQIPLSGGANFFRLNYEYGDDHPAFNNKKRRRLHQEGKYTPASYLMIWPRAKLLNWAGVGDLRNGHAHRPEEHSLG